MSQRKAAAEKRNNKSQTKLHVYPFHLKQDEHAKVLSRIGTQTVITTPASRESDSFISILRFIPYREITSNCIREVDLPHKSRLIWLTDASLRARMNNELDLVDMEVQTDLSVTPHILDDDELAIVAREIDVQTSLTFTPNASINGVLTRLKEHIDHVQTYSEESLVEMTSPDETAKIHEIEDRIANLMVGTVDQLQDRLQHMVDIYGATEDERTAEEGLDDSTQYMAFAEEQAAGDNDDEKLDPFETTVIEAVVSEETIAREGYVNARSQTDDIMINCTGTNYDCGDDKLKKFTGEGVGTIEFSCQCLERVNVAAQDGTVVSVPIVKTTVSETQTADEETEEGGSFVECLCRSSLTSEETSIKESIVESIASSDECDFVSCTCDSKKIEVVPSDESAAANVVVDDDEEGDTLFLSFDCSTSTPMKPCRYATNKECCGMSPQRIFAEPAGAVAESYGPSFDCPQSTQVNGTPVAPGDPQFVTLAGESTRGSAVFEPEVTATTADERWTVMASPKMDTDVETVLEDVNETIADDLLDTTVLANVDNVENQVADAVPSALNLEAPTDIEKRTGSYVFAVEGDEVVQANETNVSLDEDTTVYYDTAETTQILAKLEQNDDDVSFECTCDGDDEKALDLNESSYCSCDDKEHSRSDDLSFECTCDNDQNVQEDTKTKSPSQECVYCCARTTDEFNLLDDIDKQEPSMSKCLETCVKHAKENEESLRCLCEEVEGTDRPKDADDQISPFDERLVDGACQTSDTLLPCLCFRNFALDDNVMGGISTHTYECSNVDTCCNVQEVSECNCDDETASDEAEMIVLDDDDGVEKLFVKSMKSSSDDECDCCNDNDLQLCECPSDAKEVATTTATAAIQVDDAAKPICGNEGSPPCDCTRAEKEDVVLQTSVLTVDSPLQSARLTSSTTIEDDTGGPTVDETVANNSIGEEQAFACSCDVDDEASPERQLFLEDISSMLSQSNQSFVCDCTDDNYIALLRKESSFVTCNDDDCIGSDDDEKINLETYPIGDNAGINKPIIYCECTPNATGAALPFLFGTASTTPDGIGPQVQSLERLCSENPSNLEAFMQRLRDMSSSKEGKQYIKNLCQETITFLCNAGYEDEIKALLSLSAPSFYLFKEDPIYFESYIAGLEITRGVDAVARSDDSLVDMTDAGECTAGVEIPWYKIELPEAGTYEIKPAIENQASYVALPSTGQDNVGEEETLAGEEEGEVNEDEEAGIIDGEPVEDEATEGETTEIEPTEGEVVEGDEATIEGDQISEGKSAVDVEGIAGTGEPAPFDPEKDCIETYQRKFKLLVDTTTIYYHEPQYESLYREYESDEDEDCADDFVLQWKDLKLRTNAKIIPTKDVIVPSLDKMSDGKEATDVDEEETECGCPVCPAVEAVLQKTEVIPAVPEVKPPIDVAVQAVDESKAEVVCECEPPPKPVQEEPKKVCAANVPRKLTCSPKKDDEELKVDAQIDDCVKYDCPVVPAQKLADDNCTCEPSPKCCACRPPEKTIAQPKVESVAPTPKKCTPKQSTKELLKQSNCLCGTGKTKRDVDTYDFCSAHTCDQLNMNRFIVQKKEPYKVDECECKPTDRDDLEARACDACCDPQQKTKKRNVNIANPQCGKTGNQSKLPSGAAGKCANRAQALFVVQHLDLLPMNTKSWCNSRTNEPFVLKPQTLSLPQMDRRILTQDFECQCNEVNKLIDECVCTTDTTTRINVNTKNRCVSVDGTCLNKDPVLAALAAYQAEMKPIKETLFQLRAKIRDLNLRGSKEGKPKENVRQLYANKNTENIDDSPTTSTYRTPLVDAYKMRKTANNLRNSVPPYGSPLYQPGLMPGLNAPLPTYFTGMYPPYNTNVRFPNYAFPPYPIQQTADVHGFHYNLQTHQTKENQRRKSTNNNSNLNCNHSEMSSTSLKTTTTQTRQKKRDRRKRKPNISSGSSSNSSEHNIINVASSTSKFPVKEEKVPVENNLDVKYGPEGSQRADIGPAFVDVRAIESGGKYNLKIALKMKPPDSTTTPQTTTTTNSSKNTMESFTPRISFN